MIPSKYQEAIWRHFSCAPNHLAVIARAGSGKTTTIIEGLQFLPGGRTLICAFNTEIRDELEARVKRKNYRQVKVLSLHGLGFAALKKSDKYREVPLDKDKGTKIIRAVLKGTPFEKEAEVRNRIDRAVGLVKSTLTLERAGSIKLISEFCLDTPELPPEKMAAVVADCCRQALIEDAHVDFDDMMWFPFMKDLPPPQYDHVIVDEAQDMCAAQLYLARAALKPGGKMILVGDPCQAIYSWRGADPEAIDRMTKELGADVLPLTVSYRCPREVVHHAQRYVQDLEAAPDAPDGEVEEVDFANLAKHARPGDYILSRANAPLAKACFQLMRAKVPARVIGRDLVQVLARLVKRSRAKTVPELLLWLDRFEKTELNRLADRESARRTLLDILDTIRNLAEGELDLDIVNRRIEQVFVEESADPSTFVACSTVHKAKGKERDRVFLLEETFLHWPGQEERNIHYVAITRAKQSLYLVRGLYPARET